MMLVAVLVNVLYVEWSTECLKGLVEGLVTCLLLRATKRNSIYFCYEDVKSYKEWPALLEHTWKNKKRLIWGGSENRNIVHF